MRQSRCPAYPHWPLPIPVQSAFVVQAVVSFPAHVLLRVARKTVKAVPFESLSFVLQEYLWFTLWIPLPDVFLSQINPVLLSMIVPSPWR